MIVIPAIDIRGGRCVRLVKGDPARETVYGSDPVEMGRHWAEQGAERIHVVDLDGALDGTPKHLELAGRIKKETGRIIQFGGGLRDAKTVEKALELGIDRVILGTVAIEGQPWVEALVKRQPERFIVALDAKNDEVTREGWQKGSSFNVQEALKKMEALGFQEALYTDIDRDGTLEGPNVDGVRRVVALTRMGVYASGGVSKFEDIKTLAAIKGLRGAIVGKALYAGTLTLKECAALVP